MKLLRQRGGTYNIYLRSMFNIVWFYMVCLHVNVQNIHYYYSVWCVLENVPTVSIYKWIYNGFTRVKKRTPNLYILIVFERLWWRDSTDDSGLTIWHEKLTGKTWRLAQAYTYNIDIVITHAENKRNKTIKIQIKTATNFFLLFFFL